MEDLTGMSTATRSVNSLQIFRRDGVGVDVNLGKVEFKGYDSMRYDAVVQLGLNDEETAVVCERIELIRKPGGDPVNARGVQRANVGTIVAAAVRLQSSPLIQQEDGAWKHFHFGHFESRQLTAELAAAAERASLARTGRVTDDELRRAATAYKRAQRDRQPTTRAVADELGVSSDQARQRVRAARLKGLLPPAGGTTRPRAIARPSRVRR